ncbi:unnamed protein product [Phytophthora fragariaefolia]|uniref:Unnamed protein product n=1 Tax=Phytophthora fragariaefolia TaxID=1490495 RepID=A0A9W6YRF3_9STRA|nr:unnamed protein product [Phytophthora fragariaefolia]
MRELCAGWEEVPSSTSGAPGTFFGKTMNAGTLVRAFESELHYATLTEAAFGGGRVEIDTASEPGHVNASSLPVFVDAGVNILAPDGLDGLVMAAMVWSWAENEPDVDTATAVQLSAADGRWYGVADSSSISHVACNTALLAVLKAAASDATAQLDVDLSNFLAISAANDVTARVDVGLSSIQSISVVDQVAYDTVGQQQN